MVHGLNQAGSEPKISKCSISSIFSVLSYVQEQVSDVTLSEKQLDYLGNCKSEISNVCNTVEGYCLQAMKIGITMPMAV